MAFNLGQGFDNRPDRELTSIEHKLIEACCTIRENGLPPTFADAFRETHPKYRGKNAKQRVNQLLGPKDSIVRREIARRQAENAKQIADEFKISASDVFRRLQLIAFADAGEFVGLRQGCCRYCWGTDGLYQRTHSEMATALAAYKERESKVKEGQVLPAFDLQGGDGYNEHRDPNPKCGDCHGHGVTRPYAKDTSQVSESARALYAGLKVTREGIEVKFHSQEKALELVGKQLGMFVENVDVKSGGKPLESDGDRIAKLVELVNRARSRADDGGRKKRV